MPENTDDRRLVTIALLILGAVVVLPMLFVGTGMMGSGPMMGGTWGSGMWGDGTTSGWLFVGAVVMRLLFLVALVGGGYLVYRAVAGGQRDADTALEELRRAYARGELTDEEYEKRRETLERDT